MADKKHIYFDKTEIMMMFLDGNQYQTINLTYDKIIRIQFDKCTEKKFFRKVPSERIQIVTNCRNKPIEYTKMREKKYFDEYKQGLAKFAKDNRISFIDGSSQ